MTKESKMTDFTVDRLREHLVRAAGAPAAGAVGEFAELEFSILGYDSLALMEAAARVGDEIGVRIPDEDVFGAKTPREFVGLVNAAAGRVG
jgi:act minimal PKS acyl carrier protein